LWVGRGGDPEHLRLAVRDLYRFRRYADNGALYVEKRATPPVERAPAPVVVLGDPDPPRRMPEKSPGT